MSAWADERIPLRLRNALLSAACLAAVACSVARDKAMCIVGDQKACPCLGGQQGLQICLADGTYQACTCPPGSGGAEPGGNNDLSGGDDPGDGGVRDLSGSVSSDLSGSVSSDLSGSVNPPDLAQADLESSAGDLSGAGSAPDLRSGADLGPGIMCGAATCAANQVCCLAGSATNGSCSAATGCDGGASPFSCDGPENCPGAQCCVEVYAGTHTLSGHAECGAHCTGSLAANGAGSYLEQSRLCHSDADCAGFGGTILGVPAQFNSCCHSAATAPYHVCIPSAFASYGGYTCP